MEAKIETPRADALEKRWNQQLMPLTQEGIDLCRELEREIKIQQARFNGEAVGRILKHISKICGECGGELTAIGCAQCWQRNAEDFAIRVAEFVNDWSKGDFALPTLAAHDAEALKRPLETFAKLKASAESANH